MLRALALASLLLVPAVAAQTGLQPVEVLSRTEAPAVAKEARAPASATPPAFTTVGPDGFGYLATDETEPGGPVYDFLDIAVFPELEVVTGDDAAIVIGLGTSVPLYGSLLTGITVTTNGYLSTDPLDTGSDFGNDPVLPTTPNSGGGARLYPHHDDLVTTVYAGIATTCPRPATSDPTLGCTVIQWEGGYFDPSGTPTGAVSFQAILYADGEVVYQYRTVSDGGASATVGVQSAPEPGPSTPLYGLAYSANTAGSLVSGRAVRVLSTRLLVDTDSDTPSNATSVVDCADGLSDGDCSLREAIEVANANAARDLIAFDVPGGDPEVFLFPNSAYPPLTDDDIVLDAATQPGASCDRGDGVPSLNVNLFAPGFPTLIQISGADGVVVRGLTIEGADDAAVVIGGDDARVSCLYIRQNSGRGIVVDAQRAQIGAPGERNLILVNGLEGIVLAGGDGHVVQNNWVGVGSAAGAGPGNALGLRAEAGATNAVIGGFGADERNVFSFNTAEGIRVEGAPGIEITNNYVGVAPDGSAGFASNGGTGIVLTDGTTDAVVRANVVSGNGNDGIAVSGAGTDRNRLFDNVVGLLPDGVTAAPNGTTGVAVFGGAKETVIGAPHDGNVLSGNAGDGIYVGDAGTDDTVIESNVIGLSQDGLTPVGNGTGGIRLLNGPNATLIGGATSDTGNRIAANGGDGILVLGPSVGTVIRSNTVGLNAAGDAFGHPFSGIAVIGTTGSTIGAPGSGNTSSGNGTMGIYVQDAGGTVVQDNISGLGTDGDTPRGNGEDGILVIGGGGTVIGGVGAGNLISSNTNNGIRVIANAFGTEILGNTIGLDATGLLDRGNGIHGVRVENGSQATLIGRADLANSGNLIAGNGEATFGNGIDIRGAGTGSVVVRNTVGLNEAGDAIPNSASGIAVIEVGETTVGGAGVGNLIGGNTQTGVFVRDAADVGVFGNTIGLAPDGVTSRPNGISGVILNNATDAVVGAPGAGNVIASSAQHGIYVFNGSTNARIQSNLIGLAADGTTPRGNTLAGIDVADATGTLVGTDADGIDDALEGNTIANNDLQGGTVTGDNTNVLVRAAGGGTVIRGNRIGTTEAGTALAPGEAGPRGVYVRAPDVVIGGADPVLGNVVSGHFHIGVEISGPTATGAVVQGNRIGVEADGVTPYGNVRGGLILDAGSTGALVGSLTGVEAEGNVIAYTDGYGVRVKGATSAGHRILVNAIFDNVGLGIDLSDDGVTPNDAGDGDSGPNDLQNYPVVTAASVGGVAFTLNSTPSTDFRVELFASAAADPSGFGEGERFLGATTVTTDGSGDATGTFPGVGLTLGEVVAMTATPVTGPNPGDLGGTSEFSAALEVAGPPFLVTGPAPLGALAHGDVASVRWTTLAGDIGPSDPVRVSIVCPGEPVFVRYASTPNDGLAGVLLPASLGTHGSATDQASGCTAEVALASNPARAAESAPFVVYPTADKILAVSTRAVDRLTSINPARYGLGDIVSWFWDETSVASTVDLSVVCDGRSEYVRYTATANDGVATAQLPLVFGAFETCRVEVTSSADPGVFGRSGPFAVLDAPLPALDLVAPVGDEAIAMGQTYAIEWTSEAVPPETTVRLVLRDLTGGSPNRFVGATTNTGAFAWAVPADLSPSDEYRLAISARLADETVVVSSVNGLTFTAPAVVAARSALAEAPPEVLTVEAPRPNPTREQAVVRVGVPETGAVSVAVYDVRGRRVSVAVAGTRSAGWHDVRLDAGPWAPGVYVVRVVTGAEVLTRTLTIVR